MNKKNNPEQSELEYRSETLNLARELAMREGFYSKVDAYPFMGEATLSLEERLKLAIMLGGLETVQRALELGADVTQAENGIDLLHFAEIHGREDLLPILKAHINEEKLDNKPKKTNKSQK